MHLPPEVWLEALYLVPASPDLARMMQVSRFFNDIGGPLLYHSVALKSDEEVARFSSSISLSKGRRTSFVHELRIMSIEASHPQVRVCISSILESLPNLHHFTLTLQEHSFDQEGIAYYFDLVLEAPMKLRSFHTNLQDFEPLRFMELQPDLVDLRWFPLENIIWSPYKPQLSCLTKARAESLRVLSCPAYFLSSVFPAVPRLTHLHISSLVAAGLLGAVSPFFTHLVSLRLGRRIVYPASNATLLTVHDIAKWFPRLRFLQLDMVEITGDVQNVPYLDLQVGSINWEAQPNPREAVLPRSITVSWSILPSMESDAAPSHEITWQTLIETAALDILKKWRDYVPRIICRHHRDAGLILSLSEDGLHVEKVESELLTEDYWSGVAP